MQDQSRREEVIPRMMPGPVVDFHGAQIPQEMLSILRALTDEVKTTVVDTITSCEKSFSFAQSRQNTLNELAISAARKREEDLPIIRKELLCTGCESQSIKGNLYLMLTNLSNDNLFDRVICQQCFDHSEVARNQPFIVVKSA